MEGRAELAPPRRGGLTAARSPKPAESPDPSGPPARKRTGTGAGGIERLQAAGPDHDPASQAGSGAGRSREINAATSAPGTGRLIQYPCMSV